MAKEVRINTSKNISPLIKAYVQSVLNQIELDNADHVISLAFSENMEDQELSGEILTSLIPQTPKRPLYYVNYEVSHGPHMATRYVVHYLCAFTNRLLDCLAEDLGGYKMLVPFGGTLRKVKGKIPDSLYSNLYEYNKIFYRPAKHDYEPYDDKEHLFSLKDAIYCCFITMKLKEEILLLSKKARDHLNMGHNTIKEKI